METNNKSQYKATPMMEFGEAVKTGLHKWLDFKGRARRSEFWWFSFFVGLIKCAGKFLDGFFQWTIGDFKVFSSMVSILFFLPISALLIRRLHDIGLSGWWVVGYYVLYAIILLSTYVDVHNSILFIVNTAIVLICFLFLLAAFIDSQKGANKYGPSNKYIPL